jgi:SAM-dependent methyltransferase
LESNKAENTSQAEDAGPLDNSCPSCGAEMEPFYTFKNVPPNSCILMETEEEAKQYPRGDIVLGHCKSCGFIRNLSFVPALTEYSGKYEETQGYSSTFQRFHDDLAEDLVGRYKLHDKSVLEIGCGKGEFLAMLCKLGPNKGLGFDPGYDQDRNVLDGISNVEIIKDFYSLDYSDQQADFVCCKMTLEHIQDTGDFISLSRQALNDKKSSIFYLQVPESLRILKDCAFEDIYYEHCSYFTPGSLARLFRSKGLNVLQLYTQYEGQYLAIEAALDTDEKSVALPEENDLELVSDLVKSFSDRCDSKIVHWQEKLKKLSERGSVVLWGSGSKAVAFLGMVDQDNVINKVIDINPYRQNHFMPGTGQPIIAPAELQKEQPAAVIIMNAVYSKEISAELDNMGISAEVLAL